MIIQACFFLELLACLQSIQSVGMNQLKLDTNHLNFGKSRVSNKCPDSVQVTVTIGSLESH